MQLYFCKIWDINSKKLYFEPVNHPKKLLKKLEKDAINTRQSEKCLIGEKKSII